MIVSFRDPWVRASFIDEARSWRIPAGLTGRLFRRLQMIDDATRDLDLPVLSGNRLEKLRGSLAGFHAVRVIDQWRLVFRWNQGGEASDVDLHARSYR